MPKAPQKKRTPTVQLNYVEAGEKYLEFHNAWKTPLRILSGAWGCGKSIAAAYEIISQLTENPDYIRKTALVVAMTATHAKKQLWEQCFRKVLTNKNKHGADIAFVEGVHYTVSYKDPISVEFKNGSKIIFVSLEQKQALAGWSVSMDFCDELDKLPDPEIWELIQSRARGE